MENYNSIQLIDTIIPNSDKHVTISLEGKNLIITGGNGCGKTRLLKQIHENISAQVEQMNHKTADQIREDIRNREAWMKNSSPTNSDYHRYKQQISELELKLADIDKVKVILGKVETYCTEFNEKKALLRLFPAVREQSLAHTGSYDSLARLKKEDERNSLSQDSSSQFERYLVAFYNYGSHLLARVDDKAQGAKVDAWFDNVTSQLQYLFEDETLKLDYNAEEQAFYIKQDGKDPYKFDKLSSGYQSILSIYADLLMKVELKEVSAQELSGVVFIDEIDAHLHVSLQRKIFSFFDQAFPKVQFIVTTHSPFVVQSVNNSVIYDLSANEQLEDLSMYSYESILKGLLGVESKSSILDGLIEELATQIQVKKPDWDTIIDLIRRIKPNERNLDTHSSNVLKQAEIQLMDERNKNGTEE
ncbi:ATP-binding cassette domain-containing protein [Vibrio anguillarum]|uniref:ATP-binding cassette domain-containing protein n=20 Tax=Vibrio TaxID=662 RepID=A0AAW4B4G8_VIBAN|nr:MULTISPECIES: AAA family ATPase [Vibrio]AEH34793.1 ABC transporter ATP-binding protein [Vibrio anguillarum 775]AGU59847.1 ABC transporter ATP-binding protein [Vibrio anguillarum M3]ASF94217.1 ABC transporter ATP-binding protein [Vibrio anguillarum]ATA50953.1 ABC transporter ATP-binding protein [Vibrio anguillarum]AVT66251.1 ABC transporter ATP-binding protein [Vibrio anguillarum]